MNIACNNRLYPFIWAWRKREPSDGRGKKWQSINTNHWCGKLILDCFSGFIQNCFVEGKKEIKALIILGNSFHKINPPFLKGLFRCGNVVSVTRQAYNETQQMRCSPISHFKLSSSIFQCPSRSDRPFNSQNHILMPLVKELPVKKNHMVWKGFWKTSCNSGKINHYSFVYRIITLKKQRTQHLQANTE